MRDRFGNRKRIKLTEGELALGSWLYVTYKVITDETWDDIYDGKDEYLSAHHFPHLWKNGCRLCAKYINYSKFSCGRCPLKRIQRKKGVGSSIDWCGCGANSWYDKVIYSGRGTHSERISSAINICNVLARELKKERK